MRIFICVVCLLTILPAIASADDGSGPRGYAFFGLGRAADSTTIHVGGGLDAAIYRGIGASAEVGYLGPRQQFKDYGFGVFSANGLYDLPFSLSSKLRPFATGGYSMAFRDGTANGYNIGGGVNYWLGDRMGLRFEYRENVINDFHFHGGRIGWTFR
jgi:opacity protein-like surface antigen